MKVLKKHLKDTGVKCILFKSSYRNGHLNSSISYVLTNEDPVEILKTQVATILKEQNISLSEAAEFSSIDDGGCVNLDIDGMKLEWSFCEKWSYLWEVVKL